MRAITEKIITYASAIVVLTDSSQQLLHSLYPQSRHKTHVIPHGIHPTAFTTTDAAKAKLKLKRHVVLSTFGLLSRGKGIEYVLQALPKVIAQHPEVLYLIIGETHPVVRRNEGESYRKELARLVTKLHLKKHVVFYDQYLSLTDLLGFLKATDIYISTSINPNQAVSGTLSYALGTGRAVISTGFAQAKEIVTADTGRLVPIKDAAAFSSALLELLSDPQHLKEMHFNAYTATRPMLWSNVANQYSILLKQHIVPPLNVQHLLTMTDNFGLFQFAKNDQPNFDFGYTLDDNARALIVCCWLSELKLDQKTKAHVEIYLAFIARCLQSDGTFVNYFDHTHKHPTPQNETEDLQDAAARAIWALSEVMCSPNISKKVKATAEKLFVAAIVQTPHFYHQRALALCIKAFSLVQSQYPQYRQQLLTEIRQKSDILVDTLKTNSKKSWHWFAEYLGYNNAIIPESLLIAGAVTHTQRYSQAGLASLTFLMSKTFSASQYLPIGHAHWYENKHERSLFDQQPEDPASMILALVTAYQITHDEAYRTAMTTCFSWFLGNNSIQLPLYNLETGGCYDGLHPDRVNLNQGAESLVSYLVSRLALMKVHPDEDSRNPKYFS